MEKPVADGVDLTSFGCNIVYRIRIKGHSLAQSVGVDLEQTAVDVENQTVAESVFEWVLSSDPYTPYTIGANQLDQYIDVLASFRSKDGSECLGRVVGNLVVTLTNIDPATSATIKSDALSICVNYVGRAADAPFQLVDQSNWYPFRPVWLKLKCATTGLPEYATPTDSDYYRSFHDCWFVYSLSKIGNIDLGRTYRCRWKMIRCEMPSDQPEPNQLIYVYLRPRPPLPWGFWRLVFFLYRLVLGFVYLYRRLADGEWPKGNGLGSGGGPTTAALTPTPPAIKITIERHGQHRGPRPSRGLSGDFNDTETVFVQAPTQ